MDDTGHIVVPDPQVEQIDKAAVCARVSTRKQRESLDAQAERMVAFANNAGLSVVKVVKETASGVNDKHPKLTVLLQDDTWGTLVVEHKDRLSRVGFEWFRVMLGTQGRRILVANEAGDDRSDLMEDFTSIIYSFAARMYGLRAAKQRARKAVQAVSSPVGDGDGEAA